MVIVSQGDQFVCYFSPAEAADRFFLNLWVYMCVFFVRYHFLEEDCQWHYMTSHDMIQQVASVYIYIYKNYLYLLRFGQNVSRPRTQKNNVYFRSVNSFEFTRGGMMNNPAELVPVAQVVCCVLALVLQQQGTEPLGYIILYGHIQYIIYIYILNTS